MQLVDWAARLDPAVEEHRPCRIWIPRQQACAGEGAAVTRPDVPLGAVPRQRESTAARPIAAAV
jgi:hypothetical protein